MTDAPAEITVTGSAVEIDFAHRRDRIPAMLSALSVPREHIHSVEYVADPLTAIQGFKASGVGLPRLKMGTWHHDGQKDFVIANSHVPGLVIDLMDEHYSRLILSVQDAEQVVARLSGAGSSSG